MSLNFTYNVLMQAIELYGFDGDLRPVLEYIRANTNPNSKRLKRDLAKLDRFVQTGQAQFSVWTIGNDKLDFLSFSALPGGQFCPGKGECAKFCYSYKAWRNFTPFARQLQNSVLLDTEGGREQIRQQLDLQLKKRRFRNREVEMRLYVDGDFRHQEDIDFWFETIAARPILKVYGYSKSLNLFRNLWVTGGFVPENYILNLSEGGKYDHIHDFLLAANIPWVRGRFVAVPTVRKRMKDITKADIRDMVQWAKEKYGPDSKNVVCPGKCGSCTKIGHICGSPKFKGYNVLISTH